jgi:uncharacterized membrane protein (DUF373 family)
MAYEANFYMIIINFVCILVLYVLMMFLIAKYIDVDEKLQMALDYQNVNERQFTNLIHDINSNNRKISSVVERV